MNHPKVDVPFSVDLSSLATQHLVFLRTLHSLGVTLSRPSNESLRRYRDLWLTLVVEHADKELIPPPDIAWLWHCHRLAPYRYVSYLQNSFEMEFLEAKPPFSLQLKGCEAPDDSVQVQTRSLWDQRYPSESFFMLDESRSHDHFLERKMDDGNEELLLHAFDLLASTERQATFLWQVSGPRFAEEAFLYEGVQHYHQFLQLRKHAPTQVIVPTYQIDLMWHTHILSNMKRYVHDCQAILGSTLYHDDSLNDRSEGGALDTAFRATQSLWKEQYEDDYHCPGGMYRGEPPKEFFHTQWASDDNQEYTPLGPYLQMIGRHGASSTPPGEWTNVDGTAPDGRPAFVAPKDKSMTRGVTNNPNRANFIFGRGSKGIGYYHTSTRDAYSILLQRIDTRVEQQEQAMASRICCVSTFTCGLGNTTSDPFVVRQAAQLKDLNEVRGMVEARSRADFPIGVVGITEEEQQNNKPRTDHYYANGGIWLFPDTFVDAGGGTLMYYLLDSLCLQ
jgi:hypothetical protein